MLSAFNNHCTNSKRGSNSGSDCCSYRTANNRADSGICSSET